MIYVRNWDKRQFWELLLLYSRHGNIRNILRYLIQEFEPNSEVTEEYLDEKLKIYNLSEVEENYDIKLKSSHENRENKNILFNVGSTTLITALLTYVIFIVL